MPTPIDAHECCTVIWPPNLSYTLLPIRTWNWRKQLGPAFGFAKAYGDWRQLVDDPRVDLVDITTPNYLHVDVALAALAAGKHAYCEKPLAVTVADARRMAAAAKNAGVKTMVAFNNIKTPAA